MQLSGEAANRSTVVTVGVAGRIDAGRVEVEVIGIAGATVRSRRPIVPIATCIPQRPRVDVPAGMEEVRSLDNSTTVKATN